MTDHVETMPHTYPGAFYGVWADYWLKRTDKIPPIFGYKASMNHGATIVVPMGPAEVADFVQTMRNHPEWIVEAQGTSLLDETRFVGHWAAISISPRPKGKKSLEAPKLPKQRHRFFPG